MKAQIKFYLMMISLSVRVNNAFIGVPEEYFSFDRQKRATRAGVHLSEYTFVKPMKA